jgi:hypothetical protein
MKVPTDATTVFNPVAFTGNNTANTTRGNITVDLTVISSANGVAPQSAYNQGFFDRLRGENVQLVSANSAAEGGGWANTYFNLDQQVGWSNGSNTTYLNNSSINYVTYNFSRRPNFFDVVCYTGTATNRTVAHNLTVVPELMIVKSRSNISGWFVYAAPLVPAKDNYLELNDTHEAFPATNFWPSVSSSTFGLDANYTNNESGRTYVAYLFATCPGVSKVGSYTGNGTTQAISCGFTGGARFVLIKRTDDAGDWYVYDTARGMTTLTDPYLLMNSTAAQVATLGSVTSTTGGFSLNSTILAAINVNGGNYIFLAIA